MTLLERYNNLVDRITDIHLRDVLDDLIGNCEIYNKPASVRHHVEDWGLLEHSIEVAEGALRLADEYDAPVTRDYLIFCGLLHDYGKTQIDGYHYPSYIQHCMLGANAVGRVLKDNGNFYKEDIKFITNIIGSHHRNFESEKDKKDSLRHTCLENYLIYVADGLSAITCIARYARDGGKLIYDCYGEKDLEITKGGRSVECDR